MIIRQIKNKAKDFFKRKDEILLIYSMGKVGSSTLYRTLKDYYTTGSIHQVHFLSTYWLKEVLPTTNHTKNIHKAEKVLSQLKRYPNKRKKIITLSREPVSREISNFFENEFDFLGEREITGFSKEALLDIFKRKVNFDYVLNWFDTEFEAYTGIDIYKHPFNSEKGYKIFTTSEFDILVIRLEDLNSVYQEALKAFLGLDISSLKLANTSKEKENKSEAAAFFKKELKLPSELLREVYHSKYSSHFYSKEEIARFQAKWTYYKSH